MDLNGVYLSGNLARIANQLERIADALEKLNDRRD